VVVVELGSRLDVIALIRVDVPRLLLFPARWHPRSAGTTVSSCLTSYTAAVVASLNYLIAKWRRAPAQHRPNLQVLAAEILSAFLVNGFAVKHRASRSLVFHCLTTQPPTKLQRLGPIAYFTTSSTLKNVYSRWTCMLFSLHSWCDKERRSKNFVVGGRWSTVEVLRRASSTCLRRLLQSACGPSQYEPAEVADWSTTPAELWYQIITGRSTPTAATAMPLLAALW